jgi:hypothetical protein
VCEVAAISREEEAMGDERIKLGVVGVDSASLLVIDPLYLENWDHEQSFQEIVEHIGAGPGLQLQSAPGVAFKSGFGDGSYEVWATVREFEPPWGKRVIRIEIDLLGEKDWTGARDAWPPPALGDTETSEDAAASAREPGRPVIDAGLIARRKEALDLARRQREELRRTKMEQEQVSETDAP